MARISWCSSPSRHPDSILLQINAPCPLISVSFFSCCHSAEGSVANKKRNLTVLHTGKRLSRRSTASPTAVRLPLRSKDGFRSTVRSLPAFAASSLAADLGCSRRLN
eukprot:1205140-Amphidinium_carterae.1